MIPRAVLLLFTALVTLPGEQLPIRTYTTTDGLASDHIDRIVADSRGFLWFCTPEGLSRFDSSRFVGYGAAQGLAQDAVNDLIETKNGRLFAATTRGLSQIHAGAFHNYLVSDDAGRNRILAVRESRSGGLWLATPREVYRWMAPHEFQARPVRPGVILIQDILEDPSGDLLVASTTGINILRGDATVQSLDRHSGLPGDWVETMLLDTRGNVWAGTRAGLARFHREADGRWTVQSTLTVTSGLAGSAVSALAEASNGDIWAGTDFGVTIVRDDNGRATVVRNLSRARGLSDRRITALAQDQSGNMWMGTDGAGAMRLDRVGFATYSESDGLMSDQTDAVIQDLAGQVLAITTEVAGDRAVRRVNVFDGERFHSVTPGIFSDQFSWGWNQILLQSRSAEWWAATNHGLCRFAPIETALLDRRQPQACYSYGTVFRIFEDSRGGIWATAQSQPIESGDRLMRWDPANRRLVDFPAPRIPGEPPNDLVSAFAEDLQGNVWMGLFKGGLYRYDGRGFRYYRQTDGVPPGSVFALLTTEKGLWIGTNEGGLGRIPDVSAEHLKIQTYTTSQGLASNIIYCLAADKQGRIYAGTAKGVDRLDPETGNVRHFSTLDGLARGALLGAVRDRSGALWFASKQGLSRLVPSEDRRPASPRILITDLRIGRTGQMVSQQGEVRIAGLRLPPSQNQLQVDFVGIDYEPGDTVRYSYTLEGADTGWSSLQPQHSVSYASLKDGTFRFLVKAVTSEGVESAYPAEIDFTVLPPVWKRWWFQGPAFAVLAALIFAAHRYRLRQMVALERMRTAIATDLHDDIGASLTQIAILSEVARLEANGRGRRDEALAKIAGLARDLVDSMGDIVWSIRAGPLAAGALIRHMREFAIDVLVSQGIAFQLKTGLEDERVPLDLQARRHLFLMFKECIHNAARHSRCTSVTAELERVDRELVLTVADNGQGLADGQVFRDEGEGTGIPGMCRRAAALGGRVTVNSPPGGGCTVEIHLPASTGPLAKIAG
jgi:ligand-binding sensor domain-containing protein/signal transduction histidine kinase